MDFTEEKRQGSEAENETEVEADQFIVPDRNDLATAGSRDGQRGPLTKNSDGFYKLGTALNLKPSRKQGPKSYNCKLLKNVNILN